MEAKFNKYFNQTLRDYLRYPETFQIIYGDVGKITLIPNQKSRLLELIKTDAGIRSRLLDQIYKVLSESLNVGDVDFYSNGDDIVIGFKIRLTDVSNKDIGLVANIAKNLNISQIDEFCRVRKDFNKACRNQSFWKLLLKERYPEYFYEDSVVNNWERVYRGIAWYDENKENKDIKIKTRVRGMVIYQDNMPEFWGKFINEYNEAFRYLLQNLNLSQKQLEYILGYLNNKSETIDVIKYILGKYHPNIDILDNAFYNSVGNPELMKLYLNYNGVDSNGNPVKLSKAYVKKLYNRYEYAQPGMSIEDFKVWYNFLDGSYSPESLLNELTNMSIISDNLLQFIIDKLPDNPKGLDLKKWFIDNIRIYPRHDGAIIAMWKKYGKYLQNDIEELVDIIRIDGSIELLLLIQRKY